MPSSKHWSQLLQSSNPYTKKRGWKLSAAVLSLASIGGALGINFLWLNPPTDNSGSAANATKTQTVVGDAIDYRYGSVQLEITATNGKVESIVEVQATASPGYDQAFAWLNEQALISQNADFANVSGATYSSDAYRLALSSALSKLS